jgi:hypothetical protein
MRPTEDIEKLVKKLRINPRAEMHTKTLNDILKAQEKSKSDASAAHSPGIGRIVMRSPITKLAAAAIIIIAVVTGIYLLTDKTPSVTCCAWAQIADRVAQFKTCVCRVHIRQSGANLGQKEQQIESKMYISSDYGYKMETTLDGNTVQQMYMNIGENMMVLVVPPEKKYMRIVLTDETLAQTKKQMQDPRDMLTNFMSGQFKEIGTKVINNVEVKGIEVNNPPAVIGIYSNFIGRLWVDVATEYPVSIEVEGEMGTGANKMKMFMVMDGFEWGMALEPAMFKPQIPADYTMLAEMKMPGQDEISAIDGFKFFAEITDGKYPSQMNMMSAIQEAIPGLRKQLNLAPGAQPSEGMQQELINKAIRLQSSYIFFIKLVKEGNEPAYYGDKVTAEFGDAVLMRWKVSDNQYRVIFGDLTVDTVTAEELAELETMPLNRIPKAIKPMPADGTISGNIDDLELSWMPGMYITEHRVYIGTEPDKLELLADVSGDSNVIVQDLQRDTTYYWRVDEIDVNSKVTTGNVWSFNTGKLVGWWKLDENAEIIAYDSSAGGNNGTLQGNPVWQTSGGAIGGALRLDGDGDCVEIAGKPEFDITQQVTLSAWVQVEKFDKDWQAIVTKGDSAWRLSRGQGNALHFACTGVNAQSPWVNGKKDVNDGQWHQVVGVYDGAELRLYVDGALDVSVPATGSIATNDSPVMIGENAQVRGREWNGLIDDVRIYNYALSENEVVELCNGSH